MSWSEEYKELLERDKQMFSDCINKLLAQNYIVFQKEADKPYYRFIDRYATLFEDYLAVTGWNIEFVKSMNLIYVHNPTGKNRKMLTQNQTLFLFILRLIYEERQKDITLARHITTTNEEIHEKYLALKIKNRLPNADEYGKIMKLFASYSLIDVRKGCWNHPQEPIILYPSILIAIPVHAVETYYKWITEIESEEVEDEIFEENEVD
ncbi:DUF4194 domain-containing protein [Neobacillus sp. NPDC093127]|uniref:DUF4194 domain-containing protein n=1 Tax=Neobacillus sp. NPDC093127 TaxID=3364296 RepID=UPI003822EA79